MDKDALDSQIEELRSVEDQRRINSRVGYFLGGIATGVAVSAEIGNEPKATVVAGALAAITFVGSVLEQLGSISAAQQATVLEASEHISEL